MYSEWFANPGFPPYVEHHRAVRQTRFKLVHHQAHRTPPRTVRRVVSLRRRHRLGPVAIGDLLGMPASTVHAVLVRCRLNRLTHLDRATGGTDPPLRARPAR